MPQRSLAPEAPELEPGAAGGGQEDDDAAGCEDEVDAVDKLAAPGCATEGDGPRFSLSATALVRGVSG